MSEYLHGTYGNIGAVGTRVSAKSRSAIIYIGTAPVHLTADGAENVNKPILVSNMAEARKYFGYSDDWSKYTLCEAMHVHFEERGVGPLVLINVLDPKVHRNELATQAREALVDEDKIIIYDAEDVILNEIQVGELTYGVDYAATYDYRKKAVTIKRLKEEVSLAGSSAPKVFYVDPAKVDAETLIGTTDDEGLNTGLYALRNVYPLTGHIPGFVVAPGFGEDPAVHTEMAKVTRKVNGHWHTYMLTDMPITKADGNPMTLAGARGWKNSNGYTNENETVSFPAVKGVDGKVYHLSVLRAAAMQKLMLDNDGIPYNSASNTDCTLIENLYMGEENKGRIYDDTLINEKLNRYGIASAAYVGGRWALWGAHSADYTADDADSINVAETNRMMLYYLSNDFQHRRMHDVDKPKTANDIRAIVAEEQARLDALVKIGALTFGEVQMDATPDARSDIMMGDFLFSFRITTTPLAKSMTANVYWTDEGYDTYFAAFVE